MVDVWPRESRAAPRWYRGVALPRYASVWISRSAPWEMWSAGGAPMPRKSGGWCSRCRSAARERSADYGSIVCCLVASLLAHHNHNHNHNPIRYSLNW